MLSPDDPNYVPPLPAALRQIGNDPWRAWHEHLYTCRRCQSGSKCVAGRVVFERAETQPRANT